MLSVFLCFLLVVFIFLSYVSFQKGKALFCSFLPFSSFKDGLKLDLLIVHLRCSQESSEW